MLHRTTELTPIEVMAIQVKCNNLLIVNQLTRKETIVENVYHIGTAINWETKTIETILHVEKPMHEKNRIIITYPCSIYFTNEEVKA